MSTMSIRSTYALDRETAEAIRKLAGRWRTSQAEVVRRAVRSMAERVALEPEPMAPTDVIAHYRQAQPPRSVAATTRLIEQLRVTRHTEDEARGRRPSARPVKP